jgi:hypothetical protein
VRFKHNEGFAGLCRADSSGMTTIDIEPELQNYEKKFLEIFLHEVAHAKYDNFQPMSFHVSDRIPVERTPQFNFMELRAELQALVWLQYAENNRNNNLSYLEGCLKTLYELKEVQK